MVRGGAPAERLTIFDDLFRRFFCIIRFPGNLFGYANACIQLLKFLNLVAKGGGATPTP